MTDKMLEIGMGTIRCICEKAPVMIFPDNKGISDDICVHCGRCWRREIKPIPGGVGIYIYEVKK